VNTVSAALHWVLGTYVVFYAFIGLFLAVLFVASQLGRLWSTFVGHGQHQLRLHTAPVRTRR
jgi:hypothetical protein